MRFSSFVFLAFFLVNLFFVSYLISVEPLTSLLATPTTSLAALQRTHRLCAWHKRNSS